VADAGPDRTVPLSDGAEREAILLDAGASFDPDGDIVEYGWYKNGGWITSESSPTPGLRRCHR
jgi:hypothetical protein